jgi:hypothetical protein
MLSKPSVDYAGSWSTIHLNGWYIDTKKEGANDCQFL